MQTFSISYQFAETEYTVYLACTAFRYTPKTFFLDTGQTALHISLGNTCRNFANIAFAYTGCLLAKNARNFICQFGVSGNTLPDFQCDLRAHRPVRQDFLTANQLGCFCKKGSTSVCDQPVGNITLRRICCNTGEGIRSSAFRTKAKSSYGLLGSLHGCRLGNKSAASLASQFKRFLPSANLVDLNTAYGFSVCSESIGNFFRIALLAAKADKDHRIMIGVFTKIGEHCFIVRTLLSVAAPFLVPERDNTGDRTCNLVYKSIYAVGCSDAYYIVSYAYLTIWTKIAVKCY